MIEFRVGKWEGIEGLGDEILATLRPKAEQGLKAALLYAEGELKSTLTGRRQGRSYTVSKTGRLHVASAPGQPPAVLYGNLRNSVGHSDPKWEGSTLSGEWGVGLGALPAGGVNPEAYAVRLEYGGVSTVPRDVNIQVAPGEWRRVRAGTIIRIAPRPYMAPTELRVRPVIEQMLEAAI